jgi:hypothetical protein
MWQHRPGNDTIIVPRITAIGYREHCSLKVAAGYRRETPPVTGVRGFDNRSDPRFDILQSVTVAVFQGKRRPMKGVLTEFLRCSEKRTPLLRRPERFASDISVNCDQKGTENGGGPVRC